MSVGPSTIGERIRQLRLQRDPQMTQRELAERAGVSVDLISKLEQGRKQTALLVSLHKIARALDVDASMLLARPSRIDVADDAQDHGVLAIRRAITSPSSRAERRGGAEASAASAASRARAISATRVTCSTLAPPRSLRFGIPPACAARAHRRRALCAEIRPRPQAAATL